MVLIDTDPGTDDAIALLMALGGGSSLDVGGLTTVGGNVRLADATRNALAVLEYLHRDDVPVARGASRPLSRSYPYAYRFHGPRGLTARLPTPTTTTLAERAVDFLQRKLEERSTRTTILALGPLTNVARLLRLHPDTPRHVPHLVIMGGAVGVPGNVTPYAEFNFYSDPRAAQEVLASGMEITLVDLRVCRQAAISRQGAARLKAGGPAARLAGTILSGWFRRNPDKDAYELCDPVAMAAVLEPGILRTQRRRVDVETRQGDRLGETTFVEGRGTVRVSTALDTERFFELFYRTLGAR